VHLLLRLPKRTGMCIGPAALAVVDAAVTLFGQSPGYWDGFAIIHEHNPLAFLLLRLHPALFSVAVVVWIAAFVAAIHVLPVGLARVVAFLVMLSHAFGASTWLIQWPLGVLWVLALLLVVRLSDKLIWE